VFFSCAFSSPKTFDHLFVLLTLLFKNNFNRHNTKGIFLILDSFSDMWESTLYLNPVNQQFVQLDGMFGSTIMLFFQGTSIYSTRSFYFNVLSQFSLYTDLVSDLKSLHYSEKVFLNLADV
jgi:hypothetical protein